MAPPILDGQWAPASFSYNPKASTTELVNQGHAVGIPARKEINGADITGLQEMVLYGLKGISFVHRHPISDPFVSFLGTGAYADHALILDKTSEETFAFFHLALDRLTKQNPTAEELLGLAMEVGAANIQVMGLLDAGSTERYGHPTPTKVLTSAKKGKCIAVSGHDLRDLEEVLKQTEGIYISSSLLKNNSLFLC